MPGMGGGFGMPMGGGRAMPMGGGMGMPMSPPGGAPSAPPGGGGMDPMASMMGSMFGMPGMGGRGGGINPGNNYGMGAGPPEMSEAMYRAQRQCAQGSGSACQLLQELRMRQQQEMQNWQHGMQNAQYGYQQRNNPMGMGRGR